jgi:hypothetical protein
MNGIHRRKRKRVNSAGTMGSTNEIAKYDNVSADKELIAIKEEAKNSTTAHQLPNIAEPLVAMPFKTNYTRPIDIALHYKQSIFVVITKIRSTFSIPFLKPYSPLSKPVVKRIIEDGGNEWFWDITKRSNGSSSSTELHINSKENKKSKTQKRSSTINSTNNDSSSKLKLRMARRAAGKQKKTKGKKGKGSRGSPARIIFTPVGGQPTYRRRFKHK